MITIQNLSFSYTRKSPLFRHLDLLVGEGRICGLLGKNGSGKTTLLRQIIGVLFPDEGTVELLGKPSLIRDPDILSEVFYVQEEFELPAIRIMKYAQLNVPFYPKFDIQKFKQLLEVFELDEYAKCTNLSFGQKKKVQIAFALSTGVRLLLLDEPTNGLDIPSKTQFRKVLVSSVGEDQSVIISSHQVRDLHNMLDQVIILEEGKIILNEDIYAIGEVLRFETRMGSVVPENALYHEMVPGGFQMVLPNKSSEHTTMDLEALFNAVITNKEAVINLFQNHKN